MPHDDDDDPGDDEGEALAKAIGSSEPGAANRIVKSHRVLDSVFTSASAVDRILNLLRAENVAEYAIGPSNENRSANSDTYSIYLAGCQ
jgi:hypothetical protein